MLFTQGIKCLPIAAVVVTLTIVVCYNIARKLGVDPQLAILVAGGTGICGAAAVMGLSGSIKVPPEKEDEKANNEVMAVAIIAIMGTIFALLEIALGPLTGLSKTQLASPLARPCTKSPMPWPPATRSARWASPPS